MSRFFQDEDRQLRDVFPEQLAERGEFLGDRPLGIDLTLRGGWCRELLHVESRRRNLHRAHRCEREHGHRVREPIGEIGRPLTRIDGEVECGVPLVAPDNLTIVEARNLPLATLSNRNANRERKPGQRFAHRLCGRAFHALGEPTADLLGSR